MSGLMKDIPLKTHFAIVTVCSEKNAYASLVIKPKSKLISTRVALETNTRLMALTSKFL